MNIDELGDADIIVSDEPAIDALRAQHGTIFGLDSEDGTIVFRKPTLREYRSYRAAREDPVRAPVADEILARAVVVHPAPEAFAKIAAASPPLVTVIHTEALRHSGGATVAVEKYVGEGDAALNALRAQHGAVFVADLSAFDEPHLVFRKPSELEYRAFKAAMQDDVKRDGAYDALVASVAVSPPRPQVEALLASLPVLAANIGIEVLSKSGGVQARAKKL